MLSLSSAVFAAIVGAALAQSGCPREGTHAFPHESYCDSFYLVSLLGLFLVVYWFWVILSTNFNRFGSFFVAVFA